MTSRCSASDSNRSVIARAGLVAAQHISFAALPEVEVGELEPVQRAATAFSRSPALEVPAAW